MPDSDFSISFLSTADRERFRFSISMFHVRFIARNLCAQQRTKVEGSPLVEGRQQDNSVQPIYVDVDGDVSIRRQGAEFNPPHFRRCLRLSHRRSLTRRTDFFPAWPPIQEEQSFRRQIHVLCSSATIQTCCGSSMPPVS